MDALSVMPEHIVAWLNNQIPMQNLQFLTEYPARKKQVPLKSAVVSVGIERIRLHDSFAENAQGEMEKQEYCRDADIRIKLGIHVPYTQGGERCHDVFCRIIDCLTFASDLYITESGCEKVRADRDTDAFVLEGYADVYAEFCPAQSTGVSFASFLNKDLLCGSHIHNAALHFSPVERARFENPLALGNYYGGGESSRSVTLGFAPQMVVVFALNYPPVTVNFTSGSYAAHWGIAARDMNATQGIELTANGFRLLSAASQNILGCLPRLNEAGVNYCYIAIR